MTGSIEAVEVAIKSDMGAGPCSWALPLADDNSAGAVSTDSRLEAESLTSGESS
jgi:hypothetical protein